MNNVWLDVSIFRCPQCNREYADASWYAYELASDIECGDCHTIFNAKKQLTDRMMVQFEIDDHGIAQTVEIINHTP